MISPVWTRLVRFIAQDEKEYVGEPEDSEIDVGLAVTDGHSVTVKVLHATSALDENAKFTGEVKTIKKVLSPLAQAEVGTIRCIGLNYKDHAAEMGLKLPDTPSVFLKPATCLHSPTEPILLPEFAAGSADAEVELAFVIGKTCKNVSEADALDYVLGYMTSNDVTSRRIQSQTSQWGFSKGFDTFCPVGPTLVSARSIPDPSVLSVKTTLNGKVMQDQKASDMIFSIPQIIAHLSQGSTLPKGTVVLTGTPAGIGESFSPPIYLTEGASLRVWISHGLGTLTNSIIIDN